MDFQIGSNISTITARIRDIQATFAGMVKTSGHAAAQHASQFVSSLKSALPAGSIQSKFDGVIDTISKQYRVPARVIHEIVRQESGGNPDAVSPAGAMGLMQLMPATAKSLGVTDPFDVVQNIDAGVRYLRKMLDKYNGNLAYALAAYNAGPGAVDRYGGVPPYKETIHYVRNILSRL